MTSRTASIVAVGLPLALLVYAAIALGVLGWWVSGLAAPLVAWLLWRRHPRARFAAYVFFTVVATRGVLGGAWTAAAFAVLAVALMQAPPARCAWPRLRPGWRRGGDRMTAS